jgi:hypothetical protein
MITARDIAVGLGGKWTGRSGMACCPAHGDQTPSLSIGQTRDGRPLVHCFTGCRGIDVIAALRARGLWEGEAVRDPGYPVGFTKKHDACDDTDDRRRREDACAIWEKANPAQKTLVETYLRSRKIRVPAPDALRFVPRLEHYPSKRSWPCMVAAIQDNRGNVLAIQRTYLAPDGSGKAPVDQPKRSLGPMGDGAVRLGPAGDMMGLAEGIETALSAKQIYQIPVWATLSANRLSRIRLPTECKSLVIFADHGPVGMSSAMEAAERYERDGIDVDVMPPSVHFGQAGDFNDAVRG